MTTRILRTLGAGGLLTVSLALALAGSARADGVSPPRSGPVASAEVVELVRAYGAADGHEKQAVRDRLVSLGPHAVGSVVALLAGRVAEDASAERPLLDPAGEALLHDVLVAWPNDRVVEELVDAAGDPPEIYDALLVARLIGEVGDARALGELVALLARVDPSHFERPFARGPAVGALRSLLARDAFAYAILAGRLEQLPPGILPDLVRALGELGQLESVPLLEKLVGRDPRLDLLVLDALGRPSSRAVVLAAGAQARAARPLLASGDPRVRRQAALTLGRLHDAGSAGALVELLEDRDADVRRGALEALRAMSGGPAEGEVARWNEWLAAEKAWLAEQAPELAERARSPEGGQAVAATRELSSHRLHRDELAALLAPGLRSEDEAVATATCLALGRLGSPRAVLDLVESVGDSREAVRLAAADALARLTGQSFPPRPAPWREWLGA